MPISLLFVVLDALLLVAGILIIEQKMFNNETSFNDLSSQKRISIPFYKYILACKY